MSSPMTSDAILERDFLKARAKVLEVAATLDRIDRAEGEVRDARRRQLLDQGIQALLKVESNRAEQVQLIFSLAYRDDWRGQFELQ